MRRVTLHLTLFFLLSCLAKISLAQTTRDTLKLTAKDRDSCVCSPSIPLEIAASSIVWGLPSYLIARSVIHQDTTSPNVGIGFLLLTPVLLAYSLGPVAEWTSGCKASYWNLAWIGLSTQVLVLISYAALHEKNHTDIHKFRIEDYLILGVLPSVASSLIFNLFLDCPMNSQKSSSDTGLLFFGNDCYLGLQYYLKF
jgi:hypothetical protein